MNKINRVLLFGHFGPPFLTAARSLQRYGIEVDLLSIGSSSKAPSNAIRSCWPMAASDVGSESGLGKILKCVDQCRPDGLLALSDAHLIWLANARDRFPQHCKLLIPPIDVFTAVRSKHAQIALAMECGFDVLPTWDLYSAMEVDLVPDDQFPLCLRPSDPASVDPTFKVELVESKQDGRQFLATRKMNGSPIIAQPFRSLPNIVVHGARAESGELLAMESFLSNRKFEGLTLTIERTEVGTHITESCERFVNSAGVLGPFHFDLLYSPHEDRAYFLEINMRLGGTTDKVYRLGFDEPALCLRSFGFKLDASSDLPRVSGVSVNRRQLAKHMLAAIAGRLTPLDYPKASRWQHLCDSIRDFTFAHDSVFSLQDIRGSLNFYLQAP